MTVRDLLENALIGAVTLDNPIERDQIRDLLRQWKSEYNTDIELVSFTQAFPDPNITFSFDPT